MSGGSGTRTHPDPRRHNMDQTLPTLITWEEVTQHILRPWTSGINVDQDRFVRTVRLLFEHVRSFIVVSIRSGTLDLAFQVANNSFRNDWSERLTLSDARGRPISSVDEYLAHKDRTMGSREAKRALRDANAWWTNGSVLCNVPSTKVWGDSFVADLVSLISRAGRRFGGDVDIVINRRDFPLLSSVNTEAEPNFRALHMTEGSPRRRAGVRRLDAAPLLPVLGFYTSFIFADVAIPVAEDIKLAASDDVLQRGAERLAYDSFLKREPVAVFRGSNTGRHGGVQRIELAKRSKADLLDAKITAASKRDELVGDGTIRLPHRLPRDIIGKRLPMKEQFDRYRYVVYVCGHSAASRLGAILASGCLLIMVEAPPKTADRTWLHPFLSGVTHDMAETEGVCRTATHLCVKEDLSDLEDAIRWSQHHPGKAHTLASNAYMVARQALNHPFMEQHLARIMASNGTHHIPSRRTTDWFAFAV